MIIILFFYYGHPPPLVEVLMMEIITFLKPQKGCVDRKNINKAPTDTVVSYY